MAVNEEFLKFIQDQLSEFGEVDIKRMFGGIGIFKDGLMFAKIGGDTFRLKVDESNKKQYEDHGMKPFHSEKKKKGMPYWEVPQVVLEDRTELAKWAKQSFEIALRSKK
ncbi:MAG: TfoX/Sxy family protein [Flavobacteriales bacterium]|nr:TfoX/Sxy family protein [Flavobacteriales bacterium]